MYYVVRAQRNRIQGFWHVTTFSKLCKLIASIWLTGWRGISWAHINEVDDVG